MKKVSVLVLALVLAFGTVALVACSEPQTVTGVCNYESWGTVYGAKVDVTVKNGIITEVKLYTDVESGFVRTTESWDGFSTTEAAYANWIEDTFVGKTVEEVNAYVATATAEGQTVGENTPHIQGATVSSARIIVAVQNALSKLAD